MELKKKIEAHFDFIWNNDKNQAIVSDADVDNFEQLPHHVQNQLYRDFLFVDFCSEFMVNIPNLKSTLNIPGGINVMFTWDDQNYRDFMINLMRYLQPRMASSGTIIFRTVEEVEEIFFI